MDIQELKDLLWQSFEADQKILQQMDEAFERESNWLKEVEEAINNKSNKAGPPVLKTPRPLKGKRKRCITTIKEEDEENISPTDQKEVMVEEEVKVELETKHSRRNAAKTAVEKIKKLSSVKPSIKLRRSNHSIEQMSRPVRNTRQKNGSNTSTSTDPESMSVTSSTALSPQHTVSESSVGHSVEKESSEAVRSEVENFNVSIDITDVISVAAAKVETLDADDCRSANSDTSVKVIDQSQSSDCNLQYLTTVTTITENLVVDPASEKMHSDISKPGPRSSPHADKNPEIQNSSIKKESIVSITVHSAPEDDAPEAEPNAHSESTNTKEVNHSTPETTETFSENASGNLSHSQPRVLLEDVCKKVRTPATCQQESPMAETSSSVPANEEASQPLTESNSQTLRMGHLFSPYAGLTVHQRSELYEQLCMAVEQPSGRVTRTRTKKMAAAQKLLAEVPQQQKIQRLSELATKKARASLAKAKIATQANTTQDETNLSSISSSSVTKFNNIITGQFSFLIKSDSKAMPNGSKEKIAEMKKKLEDKESEAQKKREELLAAKIATLRKKNEQKTQKVLKTKEAKDAMDREKLVLKLKQEKQKEEKLRRAKLLRDKLKEEAAAKRKEEERTRRIVEELAQAAKLKEQEEARRAAKQLAEEKAAALLKEQERLKKLENKKEVPSTKKTHETQKPRECQDKVKVHTQVPIMNQTFQVFNSEPPTEPEYRLHESDESTDDETKPKRTVPKWARPSYREHSLRVQAYVPDFQRNKFIFPPASTPNLAKIFEKADPRLMKRTSSAVWSTPPRLSQLPK